MKTFGGDPGVIGKAVRVDGAPAVITGVVAKSFRGTLMGVELDGYVTLDDYGVLVPDVQRWLYHNRKARPLQLFARLKPGVTVSEAQAAMDVLMTTLATEHPETDQGIGARVMPEPLARPMPMRAVTEAIPFVQFFGLAIAGARAAAGVHERREPAARARDRARARNGGARGARRQPGKTRQADGHRGPAALEHRRRGRLCRRPMGDAGRTSSRLDLGADLPLRFDATFDLSVFLFSLARRRRAPASPSACGPRGARRGPTRARRCTTAARGSPTARIGSACGGCWSSHRSPARSRS